MRTIELAAVEDWDGDLDVVVVGAGLAGLTSAAVAAASGASVLVVDAHRPGGRAAVTDVDGVLLNGGPRAWFPGGAAARELRGLGLTPSGRSPALSGVAVLEGGRLRPSVASLASAARVLRRAAAGASRSGSGAEAAAADWVADVAARDRALAAAMLRLVTYADDLGALSLDAALAQLRVARHGVRYLHGGFGQLVELLGEQAQRHGAVVSTGRVGAVHCVDEGTHSVVVDGHTLRARTVVLAAGSPAAARSLLGDPTAWPDLGPPATAACLELVLRRPPRRRFVLGLDQPLYLSQHSPPARLGPDGTRVVHLMRYGATTASADRSRLEDLAVLAGITGEDVVHSRFLRRMVVNPAVPTPSGGGLPGRPPVADPGRPGVLLAGDWVGDEGLLADAAVASGAHAGRLAAQRGRQGRHPEGAGPGGGRTAAGTIVR